MKIKLLNKKRILILMGVFSFLFIVPAIVANGLKATNGTRSINNEVTISGTILDESNEPIIGATLQVKENKSIGTVSDFDGKFSLRGVDSNYTIIISSIGFETQEIVASKLQDAIIILKESATLMDEVVVIGYGTKKKRDLTGAIASVGAKDIEKYPVKDVLSAMQGKAAGVQITSNSGAPGDGITIRVRGASSLNSGNDPLYVVDGVPIETTSSSSLNVDESHGLSPLAYISPHDIESIEVLKDAASSSIYGARAANGVVLITTKQGRKGKAKVDVFASLGISTISRKLSVLNSQQWQEAILEGYTNYDRYKRNTTPTEPHWTVIDLLNPVNAGDVDWQSEMYRTSLEKQVGISVSGGNEGVLYSLNTSFLNQDGILRGSNYKRITTRSNTEFKISEHAKVGTNVAYTHSKNDRVSAGGVGNKSLVVALITRPPTYALTYPDGSYLGYLNGKRNPVALAEEATMLNTVNRLTGQQYLELNLIPGLKFRSNLNLDYENMKEDEFFPTTVDYREGYNTGKVRVNENLTWSNENFFTYNTTLKEKHHLGGVLGFSVQDWKTNVTGLDGMYFGPDDITTLSAAGTISNQQVNVSYSHSMASFFGRLSYDYMSRYLVEVNFRADGSSRFGKDKRFGYFPSASAAWRFSDEKPLKNLNFLSDAKLRVSVGQTGNNSIPNYATQGIVKTGFNYLDKAGVAPTAMPNRDLKWETTTQYNVGLDLSFFNSRLDFSADAYIKKTRDLLFYLPLPNTTGFEGVWTNVGNVQNKGVEFTLSSHNTFGKVGWSSAFNISFNRNKITSLPQEALGNGFIQNGNFQILKVGEPIGMFYGYKFNGVYARDEDNVNQVRNNGKSGDIFKGGDAIWEDVNGDHVINEADKMIIGNPHPDFTGGFSNDISYNNFTLSAFFQFSYGNDIYNNVAFQRSEINSYNNISLETFNNRWRQQGDVTNTPQIVRGDPMKNQDRVQSRWVEDGSYIKLKTLTLSYMVPQKFLQKTFVRSLKLYASGNNLITWTKYSGYDPDVDSFSGTRIGVDYGVYPQSRSFQFGINVGF